MKGATEIYNFETNLLVVSIHAPMKGATIDLPSTTMIDFRFNPRTHEGCDLLAHFSFLPTVCFNPRTHEGCDVWSEEATCYPAVSIHAPMKGATITFLSCLCSAYCFNPRTHEGCDGGRRFWILDCTGVSIHAPMKGATADADSGS